MSRDDKKTNPYEPTLIARSEPTPRFPRNVSLGFAILATTVFCAPAFLAIIHFSLLEFMGRDPLDDSESIYPMDFEPIAALAAFSIIVLVSRCPWRLKIGLLVASPFLMLVQWLILIVIFGSLGIMLHGLEGTQ